MVRTLLHRLYGVYALVAFVVVILALLCPLLISAPTLPLRRAIGRLTVRAWLASIFVPMRVKGLQHLPAGSCIALCNHASYVDGIVFTAALPGRFTFLVQHGAARWPYVGLIIRRMGSAFVNRESVMAAALALRRLIREVRAGGSQAIFPEGGFRPQPGLIPFQGGAFLIAAKTGVPVVPAVMRGTRPFFGEGMKMPRWSSIEIELYPPIWPQGRTRADADALRDAARAVMQRHCGETGIIGAEGGGNDPAMACSGRTRTHFRRDGLGRRARAAAG